MRSVPAAFWDLWSNGGPFIGENAKPHTRVTVQPDWQLATSSVAGNFQKLPVRWWQRADNGQTEVEIPNIATVSIDRSLDQDAASCEIVMLNQWHLNIHGPALQTDEEELGLPGYFTWSRGSNSDATARWGHTTNAWAEIIVPNAMIRTYQGFGGNDKTIGDALDDGNVILTGVWLVDEVRVGNDGRLNLRCRDMAKLLIEQYIFPPLIPSGEYPLTYCKWKYRAGGNPQIYYGSRSRDVNDPGVFFAGYAEFSASSANPDGVVRAIHGHTENDAFDQNSESFWLSEGKPTAEDTVFFEMNIGHEINQLQWDNWGGLYQVFVHIEEDGNWVGSESVDGTPFVAQLGCPWEAQTIVRLDRIYRAQRVRLTFTNLTATQWGTPNYRAGIRRVEAGKAGDPTTPAKIVNSMAVHPDGDGYWLIGSDGGVFALGPDAEFFGSSGGGNTNDPTTGIAPSITGDGYFIVRANGLVQVYGDAVNYGDLQILDLVADVVVANIEVTETGLGYFLLGRDGGVFAFGDAVYIGAGSGGTYVDIAENQAGAGYWLLRDDGTVEGFGVASLGDATITSGATAIGIEPHPTGLGYWIVDSLGAVFTFGVAAYYGGPNTLIINAPATITSSDRGPVIEGPGFVVVAAVNDEFLLQLDGQTELVTIPAGTYRDAPVFAFLVQNAVTAAFGASRGIVQFDTLEDVLLFSTYSQVAGSTIQIGTPASGHSALPLLGFTSGQAGTGGNTPRILQDPISDIKAYPDGTGYWVVAEDGGVFAYGAATFWGSLPEDYGWNVKTPGNYTDYVDIVKELLLWAGFWLYDPNWPTNLAPNVYGNIESTGIGSEECLPVEMFDKKPVIDALNELRQIVGYIFWVDEEGAVHWESPNFWRPGNFINDTGAYTDYIPEIDERHNLMNYTVSFADQNLRSEIIIGSSDPTEDLTSTHSWREVMPEAETYLRGMVRPMMFVNDAFLTIDEMKIMAKLIGTHIYFKLRQASATCVANPAIQLNDQVRVYERQTGDTFIHYVRAIRTEHDLQSGSYTMTLTTHWLGRFPDDWALEFE